MIDDTKSSEDTSRSSEETAGAPDAEIRQEPPSTTDDAPAVDERQVRQQGLENRLAEYDANVPDQPDSPQEQPISEVHGVDRNTFDAYAGMTEKLHAAELQRLNQADADDIYNRAREVVAELGDASIAAGDADKWLIAEFHINGSLQSAWDNRSDGDKGEGMIHFERVFDRTMKKLHKEFSSRPDRQATEDKEAVTAAVMGSAKEAPRKPPPNYNDMSDAEFKKSVRDEHGIEVLG